MRELLLRLFQANKRAEAERSHVFWHFHVSASTLTPMNPYHREGEDRKANRKFAFASFLEMIRIHCREPLEVAVPSSIEILLYFHTP